MVEAAHSLDPFVDELREEQEPSFLRRISSDEIDTLVNAMPGKQDRLGELVWYALRPDEEPRDSHLTLLPSARGGPSSQADDMLQGQRVSLIELGIWLDRLATNILDLLPNVDALTADSERRTITPERALADLRVGILRTAAACLKKRDVLFTDDH